MERFWVVLVLWWLGPRFRRYRFIPFVGVTWVAVTQYVECCVLSDMTSVFRSFQISETGAATAFVSVIGLYINELPPFFAQFQRDGGVMQESPWLSMFNINKSQNEKRHRIRAIVLELS